MLPYSDISLQYLYCPVEISQSDWFAWEKQVATLTSNERGALITIVVCMNADGSFVPPLVIFLRKNMGHRLVKGGPSGTIFAVHPSRWIQTNLFTMWFLHFVDFLKPTKDKAVLLILDSHYSHTQNINLIDLATQKHVSIVSLPPHSPHQMQPLDKTFMGLLKVMYSEGIRHRLLVCSKRPVSVYDVMEFYGKAYIKCQKAEIATNGFRVTGIYPIDRNIFSKFDYIDEANTKHSVIQFISYLYLCRIDNVSCRKVGHLRCFSVPF